MQDSNLLPGIGGRAALVLVAVLFSGCEQSSPSKNKDKQASATCSENTQATCGVGAAAACTWTGYACQSTYSAYGNDTTACYNFSQTNCTGTCTWYSGSCVASNTLTEQQLLCSQQNTSSGGQSQCNSTSGCHWNATSSSCVEGSGSGSCNDNSVCSEKTSSYSCLQAQSQGCTWNSQQCVSMNSNACVCSGKTSSDECKDSAYLGCSWDDGECVSTMAVSDPCTFRENESDCRYAADLGMGCRYRNDKCVYEGSGSSSSSNGSGGNVTASLIVAGLGALAAILPVVFQNNRTVQDVSTVVTSVTGAVAPAVGGGGATAVYSSTYSNQCSQLDYTVCQQNFVACSWTGTACVVKQ